MELKTFYASSRVEKAPMKILVIIGLFLPLLSWGNEVSPDIIRKSFHASVLDESKTTDFFDLVTSIESPNNLEKAYQAAAYAMMAKVTINPYNKYIYVRKYCELIDEVVSWEGSNIEIRFIRLAIDHNIPGIFGRYKNHEEDKKAVIELVDGLIPNFDTDFRRYILYFLEHDILLAAEDLVRIKSRFE